ncbi:MAG: hypothetical protein WKG03_08945 [Telluria sp.]
MHHTRPNICAAEIINDGLVLLESTSRYHGAHFMQEHGIAFRVIVRVLAPGRARAQRHHCAIAKALNAAQLRLADIAISRRIGANHVVRVSSSGRIEGQA